MSGGEVSFTVASAVSFSRVDQVRFTLPSDAQTLLDNISTGDRFIFALARPTPVAVDHAVDAGNVSWTFDVPEPTITHTPTTPAPTDHAVDAGNVSWVFDIPQPTIRHTTVGPQDHAVDAGNVSWTFTIPEPTITHTRAVAVDHTVDAGNISWSFHVPQPRVTHGGQFAIARDYRLRVDWDGDGLFANAHSDVTGALVALPRAVRGRNYGDQIYGRSEAGHLEAVLRNVDGLYNRFDSTSDLVDLVVPSRLVEFAVRRSGQATYRVQWSGLLDDILPLEAQSGRNRVQLTALGPLSLITQTDVSVASYTAISVGNAMPHVLDAAEVPAARRGNINGARVMGRWWSPTQLGIDAARELEETELGFLHETKADAQIAMDGENARLTGTGRTSQYTFTRDGDPVGDEIALMEPIEFNDPLMDVVNVVTVPIRTFNAGAEQTLWTSGLTPFTMAAGETVVFIAHYPNPDSPRNRVGVSAWTDMAAQTDYQANAAEDGSGADRTGSLVVTETKAGTDLRIEVENGHSGQIYVTRLRARGLPLVQDQSTSIERRDPDSILEYQKRDYLVPSQFISTLLDAQSYAGFLIRLLKDPQTRAKVTFEGARYEEAADALDLSQRVTLRRRGVSEDMFVEGIEHSLSRGGRHYVQLLLSPAGSFGDVIVLDIGPGLDTGILSR